MSSELKYSILFESISEFKADDNILKIMEMSSEISEQIEFLKQFYSKDNPEESIVFTRT